MVSLLQQIIYNDPQIEVLNMDYFSFDEDRDHNIGELVLETLLSYNVDSIIDLNFGCNESWFNHSENVDLLTELISRQNRLQIISLSDNMFSSNATKTILTKIAEVLGNI